MRSRCSFLEFQLAIQKFALRLEPHDATILDNCLSLADEIVKQTETLDAAGGLRWLPDLPMTATTALALFLKDVSPSRTPHIGSLAEHFRLFGGCPLSSKCWRNTSYSDCKLRMQGLLKATSVSLQP